MNLFGLPGDPTDRIYETRHPETNKFNAAVFSLDRKYRYALARIWGPSSSGGLLTYVMLNPSTADASMDDATIRSCSRIAQTRGYCGMVVVNLFALRSTEPEGLKGDPDPVGPLNDQYLRDAVFGDVVVAWGSHNKIKDLLKPRAVKVLDLIRSQWRRGFIYSLGHNKDLQPKHPLYLPTNVSLQPYLLQSTPATPEKAAP